MAPQPEIAAALRRHAAILGYGHAGRTVARMLEGRRFPFVAVDLDYAVVTTARQAGVPVIYGDAGNPSVLDAAGIAEALVMVVAIDDPLATRQAVDYALSRNDRLDVVARAHSEEEERYLRTRGVSRVVVAQREIGNELVRYALHRFGVSDREVAAMLEGRRQR